MLGGRRMVGGMGMRYLGIGWVGVVVAVVVKEDLVRLVDDAVFRVLIIPEMILVLDVRRDMTLTHRRRGWPNGDLRWRSVDASFLACRWRCTALQRC